MKLVVTILDSAGIQPYIFGSNKLRENIGASYLVKQATGDWAKEALEVLEKKYKQPIYFPDLDKVAASAKPYIDEGSLIAELIYAGGGNTVLLFSEMKYAKEFIQILSKRILKDAPSINLIAVHKEDFDWDAEKSLYEAIDHLMKNELDQKKQQRIPSSPLLGLGVTADCRSTRLVAVDMSANHGTPQDSDYLISREIIAKLDAVSKNNRQPANQKLIEELFSKTKLQEKGLEIPLDVDDMGQTKGESSYIAIVHADGNSMGERFQNIGLTSTSNRDYITSIRNLSHSINEAGKAALTDVLNILIDSIDEVEQDGRIVKKIKGEITLKDNYLPFRPIVYGGDDVTFICNGRLGLELSALYLERFARQTVSDGKLLTACAGVSVVKTHYPFARAYELSESLCRNAKQYLKKENKKEASALDWHLAASGLIGSIGEIREREYKVSSGDLTMRPVLINEADYEWRTWQGLKKVIDSLNMGNWKDKDGNDVNVNRNKIITLREVLRKGSEATKEFLDAYQIPNLPVYPKSGCDIDALSLNGWLGECGYFDAIEAMEFYVSLTEDKNE